MELELEADERVLQSEEEEVEVSKVKNGQKSIRIVMPLSLYEKLKEECQDHGDISKLVRKLIRKHLETLVKV